MNESTLLYRQVNPNWVFNGKASSQTFMPTRKDQGLLSVYDGDKITPEVSWRHFNDTLGFDSIGVLGVSVAECQGLQLPVRPAPNLFLEHTVIDFNGLSRRVRERKADTLKMVANARDWLFRP